jgi:hypothetical protein
MYNRWLLARMKAGLLGLNKLNRKSEKKEEKKIISANVNPASKTVYCHLDGDFVAEYESISKCADALGMSRAMVKKAIDNAVVLENGFLLTLNK